MGLRSRRQFRFESGTHAFACNLDLIAGTAVGQVSHDDTFRNYLNRIDPEYLAEIPGRIVDRLIRMKLLDHWRLKGAFLIALDATGQLRFHRRHCPYCITQALSNGTTLYYHPVLEAKLVTSSGLAFSVASEFIDNRDGGEEQDCERKAFGRLAVKLKGRFPRLPVIILGDALYACAPFFDTCRRNGWRFIVTFKEGSLPALFEEYQALRDAQGSNRVQRLASADIRQRFAWVNGLDHQGHRVNAFECTETVRGKNKQTYHAWLTDLPVTEESVAQLSNQGGRQRWKIENQGFDVQKHHGYELEHAYSRKPVAAENFYYLLQVAHAINQLMIKGALRKVFAHVMGSLRNYYRRLAESLRNEAINPNTVEAWATKRIQIRLDTS
jgi:hypothetical protein